MKTIKLLLMFAALPVSYSFSQYCTAVGPSSTVDSNVEQVQLTGVLGAINYTGCPGVAGLQDLTSVQSTTLNAGSSYSITIKFGTCNGIYSGAGSAWIDYNSNSIFEPSEVIATWQGSPPYTGVYNFNVPAGATNGSTRMRVTQQEAGTLPLNPCATFAWGSVTDFTINIGNGIDCSGYIGDDTNDPVIVSSIPYSSTGDNSYCYSNQNTVYSSPDVYYLVNPSPLMQTINVSLCGSSFDTFLSVIDNNGNIIAFNDDAEGCGTSSELSFDTDGLGQVFIIVEGWGNESGEFNIAINADYLSVDQLDNDFFNIFPNPATNELTITGSSGQASLIDLSGKMINSQWVDQNSKIDVSFLERGVYFVKMDIDGTSYLKKLILK